ncbi:hypothetical protein M9Y10_014990 [Tritrichomonas musculus]|uniref:DUF3447 domain-containing protein n=1 Tax=Tritrichomonas musculus TaxID=1915356 RepID=A0ABR2L123_9EUKA
MEIGEHLKRKRNYQTLLLKFIQSTNNSHDDYLNLVAFFQNDPNELREFCCLLSKVSYGFHYSSIFQKIEQIILFLKNDITTLLTNFQIYTIFRKNKNILLFLFTNKIIKIDKSVFDHLMKTSNKVSDYNLFFYPETSSFYDEFDQNMIEKELQNFGFRNFTEFNEKRQNGQNDSVLCTLIRDDSVKEFVKYITKSDISPSSFIKHSIFETNSFLLKQKETTLIEYAAFYGSIKIFNYLKYKTNNLTPSIFLYAIHSRNEQMIHLVEDENKNFYLKYLKESIKCHHNEIANYIINNLINYNDDVALEKRIIYSFHYYNYIFLPPCQIDKFFYYSCKFNHLEFVKILSKDSNVNINKGVIPKQKVFVYKISLFFNIIFIF